MVQHLTRIRVGGRPRVQQAVPSCHHRPRPTPPGTVPPHDPHVHSGPRLASPAHCSFLKQMDTNYQVFAM